MFEIYESNGETFEVSPDQLDAFMEKYPDAAKVQQSNEVQLYQNDDGEEFEVSLDQLDAFKEQYPNATRAGTPGKTTDSAIADPAAESNVMGSKSVDGSLEQQQKLKYYGGTSELAYDEKEGFFGEAVDREMVNISARGVNSFLKAIKGIGEYGVSLEIAASDWYGKNIKKETKEEKAARQEQIRINQSENIYKKGFDPAIKKIEKAYIQSEKGVTEQFEAGNYGAMSRQIVSGGVESIPSLVAAYSGIGGLTALAASVAGNKFDEEFKKEPEKSSAQLLLNATGSGVIEAGFELVTRGIMRKANILKGNGKIQQAKEVIEEGSKALAISMGVGSEALAESSTQVASLLYDQLTLDRRKSCKHINAPNCK